ncbi:MAG: DUF167 family protein [Pseudomonadota bacterium]
MSWLSPQPDGVRVTIRVTPRAHRNEIAGIAENADGSSALKIAVTAVAERGKANKAAIALLAKAWGLAKSDFTIVSGTTARTKIVRVAGPPDEVITAIRAATHGSLSR